MKKIKYVLVCALVVLGMTSCNEWLNVNTDPDTPNNESALVANRLPWIQKFFMYAGGPTNYRTAAQAGVYYSTNGNVNTCCVTWAPVAGLTTTSYQIWFVAAAANINDLYKTAEAEGAYHYMAAANVFHAMGFMDMVDLYGEMPYTEALTSNPSPAYDDGKTIFYGCIDKIDAAIELFSKSQESGATPLSEGDMWCGGDPQKWIKLCYGLKARWLNKLSKRSDYDPTTILDYLSKAPSSNADNVLGKAYSSASDVTDWLWGDPIMANGRWAYAAYGSTQRISKFHKNLLVNMRGAGVEDPRMSKIVPAAMCNIKLDASGKVASYDWVRSEGVDCLDDAARLRAGGATSIQIPAFTATDKEIEYKIDDEATRVAFFNNAPQARKSMEGNVVKITYPAGSLYINSTNYLYAGDTAYVNIRSASGLTGVAGQPENDVNWYTNAAAYNAGVVCGTGSFQVRSVSDYEVITYHEMCFIRAEVLFRQGDKAGALAAYKAGIKAHMDMMQTKLTEWQAAGYNNPDMMPMDPAAINNYLSSAAVAQNANELTMSDIMLQKYVAMGCSIENYNDMRRFNYSAGNIKDFGVVYPGFKRGPLFAGQAQLTGSSPTDPTYWMRRWRLPSNLELAYNETNARASNRHAYDTDIWCYPVWWDCATDDEYYGYIR